MINIYKNITLATLLFLSLSTIGQVSSYPFSTTEETYTPPAYSDVIAQASSSEGLDTGVYTENLPITFNFDGRVIESTVKFSATSLSKRGVTYRWDLFKEEPDVNYCETVETFDFTFEDMTTEELFETYCWNGNYTTYPIVSVTDKAGSSGNIPLPDSALQIYKGSSVDDDIILVTPEVSTTSGNYQFSFEIEYALTGSPSSITGEEKIQIGTMSDKNDMDSFVPFGTPFNVNETGVFTTPEIVFPEGHKYVAIKFEFGSEPHKAMILDNIKWQPKNMSTVSIDSNDLNIYPNPTSSRLYLNTENEIESINVYDITGKQMPISGKEIIAVDNLQNGVYILNVQFVNGVRKDYKFIKK